MPAFHHFCWLPDGADGWSARDRRRLPPGPARRCPRHLARRPGAVTVRPQGLAAVTVAAETLQSFDAAPGHLAVRSSVLTIGVPRRRSGWIRRRTRPRSRDGSRAGRRHPSLGSVGPSHRNEVADPQLAHRGPTGWCRIGVATSRAFPVPGSPVIIACGSRSPGCQAMMLPSSSVPYAATHGPRSSERCAAVCSDQSMGCGSFGTR